MTDRPTQRDGDGNREFQLATSAQHMPKKQDEATRRVTARIEEIGSGGDGVALIDGARVFTPLTAPGDLAVIDVRGGRGELIEIIEAGSVRAEAPCRHFGHCGGCALQHVTSDFYRSWKRARVVGALARAGLGETDIRQTIETPTAARRRAVFAVTKLQDEIALGFHEHRSSTIVDLTDCRILHPEILARLPALRSLARTIGARSFDLSVTLCDNGLDILAIAKSASRPRGAGMSAMIDAARAAGAARLSLNGETLAQFAPPVIHFDGVGVTPPPGSFLQASREGEAALIALVKEAAAGAKKIADLFSGCGTFAAPLARSATVYAVDADRASIEALSRAVGEAQRGGLRINPVRAEARDLIERPLPTNDLKAFDAIVFDPPRAGAAAQVAEIAKSGVKIVIGVSCNPATFARDAALLARGGYTLSQVTPVDQFVYAAHVELVGVFRKG